LLVIFSRDDIARYDDPERWREAATNVALHVIPGDHLTVLSSRHLPELARLLRESLAGAGMSSRSIR
jgi:hypothetical protein